MYIIIEILSRLFLVVQDARVWNFVHKYIVVDQVNIWKNKKV